MATQDEPDSQLAEFFHRILLRLGLVRTVQTAYQLTDVSLWPFLKRLKERGLVTRQGWLSPDSPQLRRYLKSR